MAAPRTGSSLIEAYLARTGMLPSGSEKARYDELTGLAETGFVRQAGGVRPGWTDLSVTVDAIGAAGLRDLVDRVERLLEDDGVTYTPLVPTDRHLQEPTAPQPGDFPEPGRWKLDPLPLIVDDAEWNALETGLIQRSTLLDAILTDLYTDRRLIGNGHLPPELVFALPGYLRPAMGITIPGSHQLFLHAVDVYRSSSGGFEALTDRAQAPSGAGYAMADRRVVARVLPELFRRSAPRALAAFFHTMRSALESVAPTDTDEPRVVVLSPGPYSETAYDQAVLASRLGVPLVESDDLTVRRGRLWMLSMGRLEPVHVVVRRVDAIWSDPLDLRPESRLGVAGLTEASRRGAVTVVNTLGSGVLESPALLPFLPGLARSVLGETLKLPSAPTFWCGDPGSLGHVLAHLDQMVLRPVGPGRSVLPTMLASADVARLRSRIADEPGAWVGQEVAGLSEAPMAAGRGLTAGQVSIRLFSVAHGSGYVAMPGGLGRVQGADWATATRSSSVAKDVWVRSTRESVAVSDRTAPDRTGVDEADADWGPGRTGPDRQEFSTSPRVLEDMFWLGRYAERTEDLTRLLVAVRAKVDDFRYRSWHPGSGCVPVLLSAVAMVSATRGFPADADPAVRLHELLSDPLEPGTVAQSLAGLREAARSVRDQLSETTWSVLAATDRAVADLDAGSDPGAAMNAVVVGMLALTGLTAENMIRDPGWLLMDLGRRIERGLQVTALLRATTSQTLHPEAEMQVGEAVLSAAESGVTYRRRYHGRIRLAGMLELLLFDAGNPRSLAYQLGQARADLLALPDGSSTSRPHRRLEELESALRRADPDDLQKAGDQDGHPDLVELLDQLHEGLRGLSDAVAERHLRHPAPMHNLDNLLTGTGVAW